MEKINHQIPGFRMSNLLDKFFTKGDNILNFTISRYFSVLFILMGLFVASLCSADETTKLVQSHLSQGIYNFPGKVFNITSNVTFNAPVVFDEGTVFNITKGVTVKFNNTFRAGSGHIFTGPGKVKGLRKVYPEWFGAVGDGIADDTAALQKTIDTTLPNTGFGAGVTTGTTIVLTKSYLISSLTVSSTYVTIHAENAWLIAKKTGKYPHLLRFTHHFNRVTGTLYIEGNYNLGYDCIINVNARHFTSYNVTIWRASLPWLFGNRNWATSGKPGDAELGDSEIEIIGGATVHCLRGVEAVGANTIVLFSNVLIYSYPWTLPKDDPRKTDWESADTTLVRCIGSMVYFTGGGLANFTNKVPLLEVQPIKCTKRNYYSNYGGIFIANAHLEVGNLFAARNPYKIPTQDYNGNKVKQKSASLMLTNCGGYMTGDKVPINTDPMFTGDIKISNCNFYGINRKSVYAKIGNPLARISIDEESFNDDRVKGLNSVVGGTRIFTQRMIFESRKTSQAIGKNGTVIAYTTPTQTSDTDNFQACYDAKTGKFTIPVGGFRNVRISAGTYSSNGAGTDIAKMMILRNGQPVCVSQSTGSSAHINFTISSLSAGDTIEIKQFTNPQRNMDGGEMNYFQIVASRY